MPFYTELAQIIEEKNPTKEELGRIKLKLCGKYGMQKIPTDIEIMQRINRDIITKPGRTIAGISPVAIMTMPSKCPHGKCIYCPGGISSEFGNVPQSYTGKEPATRRAIRNNFDAYPQTMNRLEQYTLLGHCPEKVELIIMGGTFPSMEIPYQQDFIRDAFKAMNDFSGMFYTANKFSFEKFREFFETLSAENNRDEAVKERMLKEKSKTSPSLEEAQLKNETSNIRCVGLTIETRPDFAGIDIANRLLHFGCTKVELGVQTVYDNVLRSINRGHDVKATIDATRTLKDLGFKICYHIMPGLPGVAKERDIDAMKEYANNEDFKPDMMKIYPCMVLRGTKLYELWKAGNFNPLSTEDAAEILLEFKKICPEWLRIMRVQRDIPTFMTEAGVDKTNLRQYIAEAAKSKGIKCSCIRCREPKEDLGTDDIEIKTTEYIASRGKEFFISAVAKKSDTLIGYCRLRIPSQLLRKEITQDSILLRELRVYGKSTSLGKTGNIQHRGIGKSMMQLAEDIAMKNNKSSIVAISGIGAKEYFRKLGYQKEGPYMVKHGKGNNLQGKIH